MIWAYTNISGEHYRRLIRFAASHGDRCSVILRDGCEESVRAVAVFSRLAAVAEQTNRVSEWPGTTVLSDEPIATIITFPLPAEVEEILLSVADSVFSWTLPDLPEDITFYNSAGKPWFVTVGHEKMWSIDLAQIDLPAFEAALPELRVWEGYFQ